MMSNNYSGPIIKLCYACWKLKNTLINLGSVIPNDMQALLGSKFFIQQENTPQPLQQLLC